MGVENNRILVVEDEKPIRDAVSAYLENEGYWVTTAADGALALEEFAKHNFSLIVLDLMLPKISGERVCRTIREESEIPIIMLTAKGEVEDRVLGLELGADDYLVKPFSPRELVARVRALMRRVQSDSKPLKETLEFGPLTIDLVARRLYLEGRFIDTITTSEFNLLVCMARHPGRVFSRMELVEKVLGYDYEGYERTIDSHIKNLRNKMGDRDEADKWIQTVHGVGYRFDMPAGLRGENDTQLERKATEARLEEQLEEAEKHSLLHSGRAVERARKEQARRDAAFEAALAREGAAKDAGGANAAGAKTAGKSAKTAKSDGEGEADTAAKDATGAEDKSDAEGSPSPAKARTKGSAAAASGRAS